jgi:hypothetical protein
MEGWLLLRQLNLRLFDFHHPSLADLLSQVIPEDIRTTVQKRTMLSTCMRSFRFDAGDNQGDAIITRRLNPLQEPCWRGEDADRFDRDLAPPHRFGHNCGSAAAFHLDQAAPV